MRASLRKQFDSKQCFKKNISATNGTFKESYVLTTQYVSSIIYLLYIPSILISYLEQCSFRSFKIYSMSCLFDGCESKKLTWRIESLNISTPAIICY